jgi:hypothetical protein
MLFSPLPMVTEGSSRGIFCLFDSTIRKAILAPHSNGR